MNTEKIFAAVRRRVEQWDYFDKSDWTTQNGFFEPVGDVWFRLSLLTGLNEMSGMADQPMTREHGIVSIQIFDRRGDGVSRETADSLSRHLAYWREDALELLTPSTASVGLTDESFYQTNLTIPYRFN